MHGVTLPWVLQFIVEAYQLFKARACGADAVLLIAAVLPNNDLAYLIKSVKKLGMQTLIEVSCQPCVCSASHHSLYTKYQTSIACHAPCRCYG